MQLAAESFVLVASRFLGHALHSFADYEKKQSTNKTPKSKTQKKIRPVGLISRTPSWDILCISIQVTA
jgi:hypothetical protein